MEKIFGNNNPNKIEKKIQNKRKPFNPEDFFGKGWTVVEQDKNIPDAPSIDYEKVTLESFLETGEKIIKDKKNIFLGADSFWYLWRNKEKIPEKFKSKDEKNSMYVYFDGTIVNNPNGSRFTLYLYNIKNKWVYGFNKLEKKRNKNEFSAFI